MGEPNHRGVDHEKNWRRDTRGYLLLCGWFSGEHSPTGLCCDLRAGRLSSAESLFGVSSSDVGERVGVVEHLFAGDEILRVGGETVRSRGTELECGQAVRGGIVPIW